MGIAANFIPRVGGVLLATLSLLAVAADFPERPVRIVVGAGSDLPARVIGEHLTAQWKRQVYVETLAGAGGVVAAMAVKDAPPDGHTLLNTTGAYLLNQAARTPPPYVMTRDFRPVGLIGTSPTIIVVPASLPVSNLAEFVAYANARPKTAFCGSAGVGGSGHLACEMLRHYARADVTHVPYKGLAQVTLDLLAGRVQVSHTAVTSLGQIKEGRMRAIAVTGTSRIAALPDVPTAAEQGFPSLTLLSWYGVHAPAGVSLVVVDAINRGLARALQDPAVLQSLVAAGLDPKPLNPAAFEAFVADQERTITRAWRETGAKIE